jgi:hypothetical protein
MKALRRLDKSIRKSFSILIALINTISSSKGVYNKHKMKKDINNTEGDGKEKRSNKEKGDK